MSIHSLLKLFTRLEKSHSVWFLLSTSFVFFLLRLPSLFEPIWYKDEEIYETIGYALNHGRLLYTGVFDNKPPLLYLLYSFVTGDQYSIRLLSLLVGLATIIVFFFLSRKIFKQEKIVFVTTGFFAILFALPLLEGNIANAENFILLPILLTASLFFTPYFYTKPLYRFFAGLFIGIAFLFKIVALFDFMAFFYFLFLIKFSGKNTLQREKILFAPFASGFILPLFLTIIVLFFHGNLVAFIKACFIDNFSYVNYGNQFFIPQGLLLGKVLILGLVSYILFRKRKNFEPYMLFLLLWFAFALFDIFFSARSFTHYLLMLLPSFSLLLGYVLNKAWRVAITLLLAITVIIVLLTFPIYQQTTGYYGNFLSYVLGAKTTTEYESFFDYQIPNYIDVENYLILKRKPGETVYFWSNDAALYRQTQSLPFTRYVVAYHSTTNDKTLQETTTAFYQHEPTYIVIFPIEQQFPFSLAKYQKKITIGEAIIYEKTYN